MGLLYNTPKYVELFAMRDPQEVRVENRLQHHRTGMLKQMRVSEFDRQVIRDAADTLGLKHYHVLHPAWMYQALSPFWDGHRGVEWLRPQLDFPVLPPPPLPEGLKLPEKFVAVRFYARATFPMSQLTADAARETIKQLAKDQPVIVLNSGLFMDDHIDFEPKGLDNVTKLSDLVTLTPDNNLGLQAAVLARALGFVGTYGGLAQLALRFGKPSVSLYTDWGGTMWSHRTLSEMLGAQMGVPFHVQRIADLPLLQSVLPRFVRQ